MKRIQRNTAVVGLVVFACCTSIVGATEKSETTSASGTTRSAESNSSAWTQWRGPNRDGTLDGAKWPDSLTSDNLTRKWRVQMGPSYSGPIVSDKAVFVTETAGRKHEVIRALDRATGKELWQQKWSGAMSVPFFAKANGDWIRSTPALDGDRLYVAGMRDVLVCLNAMSGEEIWRVDFVKRFKSNLPAFGCVSSPLVVGDHVYVQAGGSFVKLDKMTGEVTWRTLTDGGGMFGSAFSSPRLAKLQGSDQLVVQARAALAGVDPTSGKVLWKQAIQSFRGMNILTPTVLDDGIFTSSYGGRTQMWDVARDTSERWSIDETWSAKLQGYMSSPVVIEGHLYLHMRNQRVACLDLSNGKIRWTTRPFGKYWSMVTNGKKILALDENGKLHLIRANPEKFESLGTVEVGTNTWAHLAVSGDEIYVRELDAIAGYTWRQ